MNRLPPPARLHLLSVVAFVGFFALWELVCMAFGVSDLSPDARGDLVRLFRCSVDAAIFPKSEAIAAFSPSPKPVWCSFVASIAPHAIGITSA